MQHSLPRSQPSWPPTGYMRPAPSSLAHPRHNVTVTVRRANVYYNIGNNNDMKLYGFVVLFLFFITGVWCGFVAAVRYGERLFDFLLKLRRPVVCVYYMYNIYIKQVCTCIYIYPASWIRKCLPALASGPRAMYVYDVKVPPPAGFLLCTIRAGLIRPPGRYGTSPAGCNTHSSYYTEGMTIYEAYVLYVYVVAACEMYDIYMY